MLTNLSLPLIQDRSNRPVLTWKKIIALLLFTLGVFFALRQADVRLLFRVHISTDDVKRSIEADYGAVASDNGKCSEIGVSILKDGGNAIDSAVSVAFCLGVLNPMASGIGGGNFMIIRLANGTSTVIDSRETAPGAAYEDMYSKTNSSSTVGPMSIAVPGEVAGLFRAWEMYGRNDWETLLLPAVKLARDGFRVTKYLEAAILKFSSEILSKRALRSVYAPHGILLRAGDLCRNLKLASSLELIARQGPSVLYGGLLGRALVSDVREKGGILSEKDMEFYREEVREPLVARAMGLTFLGAPPPAGGCPSVIEILKIMDGFLNSNSPTDPITMHRTVEAMKHSFALRMDLGDPNFVNNSEVIADIISDEFAALLRKNISDTRTFPPSHYGGRWNQIQDNGTSHFCVIDDERNAVSVTSTINTSFGSKFVSESTGILLNNEMDDFSKPGEKNIFNLPPSPANFIRPRKRPLSSMAPFIVLQGGQLRAVVGGSGGPFIISATAQAIINYFGKKMTPLQAVQCPRLHHQLLPDTLMFESDHTLINGDTVSVPESLRASLAKRGHELKPIPFSGVVQMIVHELECVHMLNHHRY